MRIKIHGGTPAGSAGSLCNSCRHSRITRGHALDEEIVLCDASYNQSIPITFKVSSCSEYCDQSFPSWGELMEQAWILKPPSGKRPGGFVRATDVRDQEFARHVATLRKLAGDD